MMEKPYQFLKNEMGGDEFPLSFMQTYMIGQSEMGFAKTGVREGYTNSGNAVKISMKLDVDRFEKSLARFVQENEMLRSIAVKKNDGTYAQKIIENYEFKLPVIEAEGNTEAEKHQFAVDAAVKAVQTPFRYFEEPSFRPILIKLTDESYIFVVIADHWIGDGASMSALLGRVFQYYLNPNAEGKHTSYLNYIKEEREFQASPRGKKQAQYWDTELKDYELVDLKKAAEGVNSNGVDHFYQFDRTKLTELSARRKTNNFYVMLMAFHVALSLYFEKEDVVIAATSANRTVKYMHTFGLFAHSVANRMRVRKDDKLSELLTFAMQKHSENMANLQSSYRFDVLQFCIAYQNFMPNAKKNALPIEMAEIQLPVKRKFDRFYIGAYEGEKDMVLIMLGDGELYSESFMKSIRDYIICTIDALDADDCARVCDVERLYQERNAEAE